VTRFNRGDAGRVMSALLALVIIATLACGTDRATSLLQPGDAAAAAKEKPLIAITKISLSSSTIVINNPGVPYSITMRNNDGSASLVFIQAEMQQGATNHASGGSNVTCGDASGVLPHGNCTMNRPAFADDFAGGTGTFVPGPATLVVTLNQFDANTNTTTALDSWSLPVTLVAGPTTAYISSLSLAFSSLVIDGAPGNYTVGIWNPGPTESLDVIQAYVNQGATSRGAGGTNVACANHPSGELPHGFCGFEWTTFAQNTAGGTGTLIPGAATFRLELINFVDPTTTLRDFREVGIMLKSK
jgi:hypothetical protein